MSLTTVPTDAPTPTGSCMSVCADYISCGQTYGGCFTSCPGIPNPGPTVPDYVISACVDLGSTTVSATTESGETVTAADTVNTIGTETGIFTILTETTRFTTEVSTTSEMSMPPTNGTTNGTMTGLPEPTNTEPSGTERGIGAAKLGMVFGTLIAVFLASVLVF